MVKVIGLTGTLGSGKDVVREYLKQRFSCPCIKLSETLRNEIEKKRGKIDRKFLQDSGDEMRKKYGNHILAKVAVDYLSTGRKVIVVDGIRNPGEVQYLREKFKKDFILIAIDSLPELRFERMVKRGRKDDPKTWEEFLEMDARDQGINQPEYGQQVKRCIEMADFKIENNGTLEEFQKTIKEIIDKISSSW